MLIKLREIRESDITQINNWRNDREVINFLGANFMFTTDEIDKMWFQHYLKNRDKSVRLAIIDEDNQKHIGNVYLTNIHNINRSAEYSIFIGDKDYWSRSIGMDVTSEILRHGFDDLNLNRIYLYVISDNARAISLYTKLGFIKEGLLRESLYKNGKYKDFLVMSILKSEWIKRDSSKHNVFFDI